MASVGVKFEGQRAIRDYAVIGDLFDDAQLYECWDIDGAYDITLNGRMPAGAPDLEDLELHDGDGIEILTVSGLPEFLPGECDSPDKTKEINTAGRWTWFCLGYITGLLMAALVWYAIKMF